MPEPAGSWYLIGAGLAESSPTGPDPRFERLASAKRNIVILENLRSVYGPLRSKMLPIQKSGYSWMEENGIVESEPRGVFGRFVGLQDLMSAV